MSLRLSPDILAAAYDYLRSTRPFRRWKLPESDDVCFVVSRTYPDWGYYTHELRDKNSHEIGVSEKRVGSTLCLIEIMAHEMVHLAQEIAGTITPNTQHNADFLRRSAMVAREHVLDPRAFI